ncbi:MAG: DNA-deoxyinosine glycosylase, partial [Methylococcaceae bacterium]|nr:DNA-deoxyinosine glycosylase [Methylococcaceae bacterium]
MTSEQGFSFVAKEDAKVLILGSMPSVISLGQQQYYAHPRNAFWKIMAQLFEFPENLSYADKLIALQKHQLCLWDVIASCERRGSLDSNINNQSIVNNDFAEFFKLHPQIKHIFFNGSRADQEYN